MVMVASSVSRKAHLDLTGTQIANGRYDVHSLLGSGSMGYVYLAFDNNLEMDVVLKVPTIARLEQPEFANRFQQESRFLVKLKHPSIVTIYDVGVYDGVPFFVMQFVGGGSLEERQFNAEGHKEAMPFTSLKDWLMDVARALDFMHQQGYIHRDVKPANILFDEFGHAYLSDFGLSKVILATEEQESSSMTAAGAVVGTPNYVAPELVLGRSYDGRADQYSLATCVYEILTGVIPLEGPSASATMVNQAQKRPENPAAHNPKIRAEVARVILRGMAKNADKRFTSCTEFVNALFKALSPSSAAPSSDSSQHGSAGSTVVERPKYIVKKTSKGKKGKVPCPACKKVLTLQPAFKGKRGKCVKCGALLSIKKNLKELQLLERISSASGSSQSNDDFNLIVGQEVFGWRLSVQQAIVALVVLIIVSTLGFVYATRSAIVDVDQQKKEDKTEEVKIQSMEQKTSQAPKLTQVLLPVSTAKSLAPTLAPLLADFRFSNDYFEVSAPIVGEDVANTINQAQAGEARFWVTANPADVDQLNEQVTAPDGQSLISSTDTLAWSPLVIVMWQDRYDALKTEFDAITLDTLRKLPGKIQVVVPAKDRQARQSLAAALVQAEYKKSFAALNNLGYFNKPETIQLVHSFFAETKSVDSDELRTGLEDQGPAFADAIIMFEQDALGMIDGLTAHGKVVIVPIETAFTKPLEFHEFQFNSQSFADAVPALRERLTAPEAKEMLSQAGWRVGDGTMTNLDKDNVMRLPLPEGYQPEESHPDTRAAVEQLMNQRP